MSQGFATPKVTPPCPTIKKLKGSVIEDFKVLDDPRKREPQHLLNREPSKQSLKMKRYSAALDNDFAFKVLFGEGNTGT